MRKHSWKDSSSQPDSVWEERTCDVCGLKDERLRDQKLKHANCKWKVTTPCIELPPSKVSYKELSTELKQHKVTQLPLAIGVPGNWQIGFTLTSNDNGRDVCPSIQAKTLEKGFAELLRWIRARQYDPYMYSDFSRAQSHFSYKCPCGDDD